MQKTISLLNRYDPAIKPDTLTRTHIVWRDEFYAGGYAVVDDATRHAVQFAADNLNLSLDTTYTGKAMAALLHDIEDAAESAPVLFWNTYNARPLPELEIEQTRLKNLPDEFSRYYE